MTQGDLLAQEGMTRAVTHADNAWVTAAKQAVWDLIKAGEPFTTDAVWKLLERAGHRTHEPRALGAVMRAASTGGYIENTGSYFRSERPGCHARPIPLWLPTRKAA